MATAFPTRRAEPLAELNTTPLIDILLVLLVMLIFTLPPVTNTLAMPLPTTNNRVRLLPDPVRNVVAITATDTILWNGQRVSEAELDGLLRAAVSLRPEPELQLAPDGGASYAQSARVLRLVKQSGATRVGFVGNERYRNFAR